MGPQYFARHVSRFLAMEQPPAGRAAAMGSASPIVMRESGLSPFCLSRLSFCDARETISESMGRVLETADTLGITAGPDDASCVTGAPGVESVGDEAPESCGCSSAFNLSG